MNPYDYIVLGLTTDATIEDVHRAYAFYITDIKKMERLLMGFPDIVQEKDFEDARNKRIEAERITPTLRWQKVQEKRSSLDRAYTRICNQLLPFELVGLHPNASTREVLYHMQVRKRNRQDSVPVREALIRMYTERRLEDERRAASDKKRRGENVHFDVNERKLGLQEEARKAWDNPNKFLNPRASKKEAS